MTSIILTNLRVKPPLFSREIYHISISSKFSTLNVKHDRFNVQWPTNIFIIEESTEVGTDITLICTMIAFNQQILKKCLHKSILDTFIPTLNEHISFTVTISRITN